MTVTNNKNIKEPTLGDTQYYLVSNIKINHGITYDLYVPHCFSEYGPVSLPFVRTAAFQCQEVTYDFELITVGISDYTTEQKHDQPYMIDLVDVYYRNILSDPLSVDHHTLYNVRAMPMSTMIVPIDTVELELGQLGDVDLAIFMYLHDYLLIDFFLQQLSSQI